LTNPAQIRIRNLEPAMRASAVLFSLALIVATPAAAAEALSVRMNQNAAVRLASPARSVVVGNPAIADVTMLDARSMMVVGKSYGVTNVIVIDAGGRTILDRQVVVTAPDSAMTYFKGGQTQTFACAERCEALGEATGAPAAASAPTP
jgi:Flp pilus assembly secretin CpaC